VMIKRRLDSSTVYQRSSAAVRDAFK
jgi:hypothetical protein